MSHLVISRTHTLCDNTDYLSLHRRIAHWVKVSAYLSILAFFALNLSGCASTEELYARYDDPSCPEVDINEWHWAILFPYNSNEIASTEQQYLQENLTVLQRNPEYHLILRGFTDSVASERYNLALSERRVNAVAKWFETHGVPAKQISKSGLGETWLLNRPNTGKKEDANRRVEMLLVDGNGQPVSFNAQNNSWHSHKSHGNEKAISSVVVE